MQLNLTATFATGRYHGRAGDEELEFPPSPSRLFQALIAGSYCGAYGLVHADKRDRALRWLESLEPPVIEAPAVREAGRGMTNYVPNNDNQMPLAHIPNSGHIRTAKPLLAMAFPASSEVLYRWRFEGERDAIEKAAVICSMARLVTHLGQHQDTVYVRGEVTADAPSSGQAEVRLPIEKNDGAWSSPKAGALDAYRQRYQTWLNGDSKDNVPIPSRRVNYRSPGTIRFDVPMALFELWHGRGNEEKRRRYDPRDLLQPAGMVRHAMLEWLEDHSAFRQHYGEEMTSRLVAGHDADKQHDGAHIACVPIPTMREEGEYDGLIRRVLLIGFGCEGQSAAELFESVANGINGADLKDRSAKVGYLKKASLNDSMLRLFIGKEKAYRVWRTVTPIVMTGLMRRGRGAEALIARVLRQAGVSENDIESIAAFSGPVVPKTVHALDYRIGKNSYLAQTPRYHAEVIFKRPVVGPLVVGRGRHSGFGLLMPYREKPPADLN
jgi:CRISPR-associated protein Csb2